MNRCCFRLASQNQTSRTNRITAYIIDGAAAPISTIPHIVLIGMIIESEGPVNPSDLADLTGCDDFLDSIISRMIAVHKCFCEVLPCAAAYL
ncbi:hypothetical protein D3C71_1961460 [compost metagenome]